MDILNPTWKSVTSNYHELVSKLSHVCPYDNIVAIVKTCNISCMAFKEQFKGPHDYVVFVVNLTKASEGFSIHLIISLSSCDNIKEFEYVNKGLFMTHAKHNVNVKFSSKLFKGV